MVSTRQQLIFGLLVLSGIGLRQQTDQRPGPQQLRVSNEGNFDVQGRGDTVVKDTAVVPELAGIVQNPAGVSSQGEIVFRSGSASRQVICEVSIVFNLEKDGGQTPNSAGQTITWPGVTHVYHGAVEFPAENAHSAAAKQLTNSSLGSPVSMEIRPDGKWWFTGGPLKSTGSMTLTIDSGAPVFRVRSDTLNPLTFLLESRGYVYVSGNGTLVAPSGKTYQFGATATPTGRTVILDSLPAPLATSLVVPWSAANPRSRDARSRTLEQTLKIEVFSPERPWTEVTKNGLRDTVVFGVVPPEENGKTWTYITNVQSGSSQQLKSTSMPESDTGNIGLYIIVPQDEEEPVSLTTHGISEYQPCLTGLVRGAAPYDDFYDALGLGTVFELSSDRWLDLFGIGCRSGRFRITKKGFECQPGAVVRQLK